MLSNKIWRYFFSLAAVNYFRGGFLICLAWSSTLDSANASKTGLVFLISSLLGFILNPFSGVITDGKKRANLVYLAQIFNALACVTIIFAVEYSQPKLVVLLIAVVFNAIGSSLLSGSMDAILQTLTQLSERRRVGSLASVIRQASLIVSAGGTGLSIDFFGFKAALFILMAFNLLIIVLVKTLNLSEKSEVLTTASDFYLKLKEGGRYVFSTPLVLFVFLAIITAFSFGQIVNVLLAPFIKVERGLPGGVYGSMDSLWSIGGVIASFLAYKISLKRKIKKPIILSFFIMSMSMFVFHLQPLLWPCYIAVGIAGAAFSIVKVILDGMLLEICPDDVIGRVRSNIQSGISAGGCIIFLITSLLGSLSPSLLFMIFGGAMFIFSILLFSLFKIPGFTQEKSTIF
ncbi:UNVERIFIED_ORG: MFS family permease [Rahnella aquatilis]